MSVSWIGWVATAVFASSYLFKHPVALRRVQGGAAILGDLWSGNPRVAGGGGQSAGGLDGAVLCEPPGARGY